MEGQIEVLGVPGALQVCHLTRLVGGAHGGGRATRRDLRFRDGEIVGAECDGAGGGVRRLRVPGLGARHASASGPAIRPGRSDRRRSSTALLLDGCRRLDEANREQNPARRARRPDARRLAGGVLRAPGGSTCPAQQAQALHLLVQRGRQQAQGRGRAPLVPVGGRQRGLDELSLVAPPPAPSAVSSRRNALACRLPWRDSARPRGSGPRPVDPRSCL